MQTGPRTVATAIRGVPPSAATQQAPPPPTATSHPTCPTCRAQAGNCTTLLPWVRSLLRLSRALGQPAAATASGTNSLYYSVGITLGLPRKTHCQCMKPRAGLFMRNAGGGLVQIFGLDSDCSEPDGATSTSKQGVWLKVSGPSTPTCGYQAWREECATRVRVCMQPALLQTGHTPMRTTVTNTPPHRDYHACQPILLPAAVCCLPMQPAH